MRREEEGREEKGGKERGGRNGGGKRSKYLKQGGFPLKREGD